MKVRIGYGFGTGTTPQRRRLRAVVDTLERLRFDSLWLSERIGGEAPDPLVAMAFAAGRTTKLKFGMSVMVLPGRNPVVLAKELATLDRLSNGRLLPAFGLGVADPHEQQAFGVERTRAGQDLRRGADRAARRLVRGHAHPPRRPTSTTTTCACCPSRASTTSTCGWAASPRRELQAGRAARPTDGCPAS